MPNPKVLTPLGPWVNPRTRERQLAPACLVQRGSYQEDIRLVVLNQRNLEFALIHAVGAAPGTVK